MSVFEFLTLSGYISLTYLLLSDKAKQAKLAKQIAGQKGPLKTKSHGISGSGGKGKK